MVILDFGSGNTCKNDYEIIAEMYIKLARVVPPELREHFVVKWQLFLDEQPNVMLTDDAYITAEAIGSWLGFKTTASAFDAKSIEFLMGSDIPFVKIANRTDLGKIAAHAENSGAKVYQSVPDVNSFYLLKRRHPDRQPMCCISKYPAELVDYREMFTAEQLSDAVSDHTVGMELYARYKPKIWEKHYVLEHDKDNPDAGAFAFTPEDVLQFVERFMV